MTTGVVCNYWQNITVRDIVDLSRILSCRPIEQAQNSLKSNNNEYVKFISYH